MGTTNQDNRSNSADVNQQDIITDPNQADEAPAASPQPEQPTGQDSDAFSGIDRATLTPDMQKMYDSMNGDYTKSKQALADQERTWDERRDFAAIGEMIENNPQLNGMVWDYIGKVKAAQNTGEPLATSRPSPAAPETGETARLDQMTPEQQEAYLNEKAGRNMISEEVMKVVGPMMTQLNNLAGPVNQMTTYMSQNQANTEYELLCNKYPAARTVRPQELQTVQLKYNRTGGGSITTEEAFLLYAATNPALLSADPNQTPAGGNAPVGDGSGNTGPTGVERGGIGAGAGSLKPGTRGFAELKATAAKLLKDGTGGVANAVNRAREIHNQRSRNTL